MIVLMLKVACIVFTFLSSLTVISRIYNTVWLLPHCILCNLKHNKISTYDYKIAKKSCFINENLFYD